MTISLKKLSFQSSNLIDIFLYSHHQLFAWYCKDSSKFCLDHSWELKVHDRIHVQIGIFSRVSFFEKGWSLKNHQETTTKTINSYVTPGSRIKPQLTLYTPTSVSIFSSPFSTHFLRCWQGEFDEKSSVSLAGDHFIYSHNLYVWFRSDIVRRK